MKSKIERLEQILKRLIESSSAVSRRNEREQLFQKLIAALMDKITSDTVAFDELPTAFSIHLNPKVYAEWQMDKELIDGLVLTLQEAAVEAELVFNGKPSIFLESYPELPESDLQVYSILQERQGTKTAILSPAGSDENNKTTARVKLAFLILGTGKHFSLNQTVINIGRRDTNELVIDDLHISREHAQIRSIQENFVIFDLNSKGGTFVNGRKIVQHVLKPGDVISLAGHPLIYVEENDDQANQTEGDVFLTTRMEPASEESEEKE